MTLFGGVYKNRKDAQIKWSESPEFDPVAKGNQSRQPDLDAMCLSDKL